MARQEEVRALGRDLGLELSRATLRPGQDKAILDRLVTCKVNHCVALSFHIPSTNKMPACRFKSDAIHSAGGSKSRVVQAAIS